MTPLTPATTRRLLAMLDLAERPGAEGERTAAEHAVGRLVIAHAAAIRVLLTTPAPAPYREPLIGTWRTTCAELAQQPSALRPWERRFVSDLPNFRRISSKQRCILSEIAERLGVREAAR